VRFEDSEEHSISPSRSKPKLLPQRIHARFGSAIHLDHGRPGALKTFRLPLPRSVDAHLRAVVGQPAGRHGLTRNPIKLRVLAVPRFWGPGMSKNRAGGCASARAIASLAHGLYPPIRYPRFRARPSDSGGSLHSSSLPGILPILGRLRFDGDHRDLNLQS